MPSMFLWFTSTPADSNIFTTSTDLLPIHRSTRENIYRPHLLVRIHLWATERHLPYGITQCYLNERLNPSQPGRHSIYLPSRDARLSAELTLYCSPSHRNMSAEVTVPIQVRGPWHPHGLLLAPEFHSKQRKMAAQCQSLDSFAAIYSLGINGWSSWVDLQGQTGHRARLQV